MRIFLVGYMGCGKTTLGRKLAAQAGLTFIDLDKFIEERNLKTVPQIFDDLGEEAFREIERRALNEVTEFENVVIATGGGAPCFFNNMEVMNNSGITIFLDIDPGILAQRLITSKNDRPLVRGKSLDELTAFIAQTLTKRKKWYSLAKIVVTEPDINPEWLLEKLL